MVKKDLSNKFWAKEFWPKIVLIQKNFILSFIINVSNISVFIQLGQISQGQMLPGQISWNVTSEWVIGF